MGLTKKQSIRLLTDIYDFVEKRDGDVYVNLFDTGIVLDLKKTVLKVIDSQIDQLERKGMREKNRNNSRNNR